MAQAGINSNGFKLNIGTTIDQGQLKKCKTDLDNFRAKAEKDGKINITINYNKAKGTKTQIEQITQATGEFAKVVTKLNSQGQPLEQTIISVGSKANNATKGVNSLNSSLNNLNSTGQRSKSIFSDFTDTFMKMVKFNTINLIYDGLITKISEAIQITNDFDAAMTEFKKVTDTSNLSLSEYTETLGQYGEAVARTQTQMLEAATEFSKAGFDPNTAAQLSQIASLYQNIADDEISAGEAASFIISQMKAFGIEANNATSILDKLNEVSNNYSVSSTDIASALTKQSASLAAYGNSLDESIALVTAGSEIMTNQSGKVARGLRTIGANIVNLAQTSKEFEITVNGATKTIQLWNETGTDMLDTYDVLKQISAEWEHMTNAEKSSLAITLAKKTQMDTFLAVMSNFEDAEKAYTTALNSEGSAWKENAAYMESVEAHQAKLKAEWEKLVLSQPIKDFENALLSAGTTLLKFVNSDVGQLIIKIITLTSVIALLNTALTAFNTLAANSSAGTLLNSIYLLITGETTLTAVTETLTTAMLSNPLFWGAAVITGVVLLVNGLKKLSHAYEEQVDKLRQVSDEYEQQTNTVNNLEEQLQKVQSQIEQLEKKKLEITDDEQLKNLQDQSNELKTQEANLKNQLVLEKAKTEELERQAKLELNKSLNKSQTVTTYDFSGNSDYITGNAVDFARSVENTKGLQGFETQLQGYENLKNKLREVEQEYINLANAESQDAEAIADNQRLQDELKTTMEDLQSEMYDNLSVAQQMVELNHEDSDAAQDLINRYDNLVNAEESVNSTTKTTLDEINDLVESAEDGADSTEKFANAWDEAADSLQTIQDAYDTMAKAVKEYNENQGYSAETLAKLNELSPEYLAALVNENGQLSVNIDLLKSEYEAQKQASIEKINMARYTAIAQLCEQQLATATQGATQAIEDGGNKALEKSNDYNTLAGAASRAAAAMSAVENGGFDTAEFQQKLNEINTMFDNMVHNVENSSLQLASTGSKSAGSHKDAWVEAFKEEKDALDNLKETEQITEYEYYERLKDLNEKYFGEVSGNHKKYLKEYRENEEEVYKGLKGVYNQVKDYLKEAVEHGYEKAINALKKEEKKVLAEIKKQIEAIKKEKEEVIKGIDKQIKALKKEKEAVEKYYNDQIDAIKRENEVLQQQNELLEKQQELQQAKQQKVMVMQQGRFQLTENESAVAQAEQNLSNYEDQLSYEQQIQQLEDLRDATVESIEERIEALEEYKEFMGEYYDEQIEAMEEYYDQVQEEYEKQIEALQEQLDAFKEGYQKEEDLENARLAAQVLGMNERKDLYEEELSNLKDYINEVNAMLALLGEPGAVVDYSYSPKTGYHSGISEVAGVDMSISSRASGDSNFAKDEMALVGESPNAELVLGSRLNRSVNSGELVHLSKGSGVVNAESTQTLAGLLNGLSTPTNVANNRSTQQNFTFGNISLPNVTDANSFVNTLSNKFNNYAIQYGNTRK